MFYKHARVEYVPVGVVGAIVPWNYPFHNIFNPLTAALFAGNAIVIKASASILQCLHAWACLGCPFRTVVSRWGLFREEGGLNPGHAWSMPQGSAAPAASRWAGLHASSVTGALLACLPVGV